MIGIIHAIIWIIEKREEAQSEDSTIYNCYNLGYNTAGPTLCILLYILLSSAVGCGEGDYDSIYMRTRTR